MIILGFILLSSCNDITTEKDAYPDIPEFPNFKNGDLKLITKKELLTIIDSNVRNKVDYYTRIRYLSKDSTFYLITFLSNTYQPDMPMPGDRYLIHLYTFKNDQIEHYQWQDDDFKINFEIDLDNNDLTIGKRKYLASSNYSNYDALPGYADSTRVDTIFYKDFGYETFTKDKNFYSPIGFDKVIIDSKTVGNAKAHSALSALSWEYRPVYLTYYKVKYKNKVGLTKVNDNKMPMFFKCKEELYFLDKILLKNNNHTETEKISIYKIE